MSAMRELFNGLRGLLVWWVVVAPWEQALRVRWGKRVDLLLAGVHLRVPGVDRIYRQSVRERTADLRTQTLTTQDGATVTLAGNVRYSIGDIRKLYDTLHHAEATILDLAAGEIARFVTGSTRDTCTPDAIAESVNGRLALERYGLCKTRMYVTDFAFVRTYRLIQDQRWGNDYDRLNTNRHETPENYN